MRLDRLLLLPALLFVAVFLFQAQAAIRGNALGFDLPFHLANGREILLTGSIPHADPFLAPIADEPPHYFPNYEWLFGVLSWTVFDTWGLNGIELLRLGLIAGIFFLAGMRAMRKLPSTASPALGLLIVTTVLILGFTAAGRRFEPRPHLISGLGLLLFAFILDAPRPSRAAVGCALGFGLLWANSHIEVLFGLAYCLLEAVVSWLVTRRDADPPVAFVPRAAISVGLFAAILASPASWRMFPQAAEYYSRLGIIMEKYRFVNVEITPIESNWWFQPFGLLLWLACAGLILGLATPSTRRETARGASELAFWFLPFLSNRYLLPATIFLIPAAGSGLYRLLERLPRRWDLVGATALVPLSMLFTFPALTNPHPPHPDLRGSETGLLRWHRARTFPEGAERFLRANGLGGRIYCPDRWGNHLLLSSRLSSGSTPLQPFVHNMNQTYSMQRLDEYLRILTHPAGALDLLDRHAIDLVLLGLPDHRRDEQFHLSVTLRRSGTWRLIFWDDLSILFASTRYLASHPGIRPFTLADPALFVLDEMALARIASSSTHLEEELEQARLASAGVEVLNTSLWLAGRRESRGDREGAIAALRELANRHPRAWPILAKLGLLLHQNGQESAGISILEQARAENPRHAPVLFNLAVAYLKAGQADLALRRLDEARLADPEFEPARDLEKRIAAP